MGKRQRPPGAKGRLLIRPLIGTARDAGTRSSLDKLKMRSNVTQSLHERQEHPRAVRERTDAEQNAVYPTPDDKLIGVAEGIRDHLAPQKRYGLKRQTAGTHWSFNSDHGATGTAAAKGGATSEAGGSF